MKKLLFIIASLLIALISVGQNINDITTNAKLDVNKNTTYLRYIGVAADSISSVDSTWAYVIGVKNVYDALKVECRVELAKTSGSPEAVCYLQGKTFNQSSWTNLTTVNWVTGAADTTIFLSYSTAKPYRLYRIYFDAVADTTQNFQVQEFELSVYK